MQSLSTDSISEALLAARTGGVLDVTVDRKRYLLLGKRYMPKDFSNDFLSGFVGRVELPKCWQTIQEAASTENCATPGLYLAGPPGAGKSALLYFLVIEARRSGMIAPYIARCDEWAFMPVHRAMGFFLDAVADANTAVSEDPCSPIAIGRPPVTVGTNWETFASIPSYENRHKTVEDMFNWCALLLQETQSHPVVLFFDEQNALYERSIAGRPAIEMQPFQIADFLLTFARGCVVLSGTADNLHLYHLRSGHDKFVHHLGHLCDYDFHHWMDKSTQFGGLAAQMYRASTGAYADSVRKYIGAITGRIPRELVSYCQRQSTIAQPTTLSPYIINRYFVDLDKAYIRHHRKRVLNIFNHYFAEYPDRKVRVLERILEMFTKSRNEVDFDAPFLALGLIYETNGQPCFLTPATEGVLLQQVIYHTRADPRSPLHHIIAKYLTVLREPSRTEEEKGYAFEKLILLRLMQASVVLLPCWDSGGIRHTTLLEVRHYITLPGDHPPAHWASIPKNTLVGHSREGDSRLNFIFYGQGTITFLEATVSHYWNTKGPSLQDGIMFASIMEKMRKWIGSAYYDVTFDGAVFSAKPLTPASQYPTPTLQYIVLCPRKRYDFVTQSSTRAKEYQAIGAVALDDLVSANLITDVEVNAIHLSDADED